MKRIKPLLLISLVNCIIYLSCSFITLNLDPMFWSSDQRALFVIAILSQSALTLTYIKYFK